MNPHFPHTAFYQELESSLASSTGAQRIQWATTIIEKNIDLKELSNLLKGEQKTAIRFLWLLSDVGILNPTRLFNNLPFLLDLLDHLNPAYKASLASWWRIAGVPEANEARAIDLLFQFLLSTETNVTTKSRSIMVLYTLTNKYPELKNELKLCLEDQMDKYSKDFRKRVGKILMQLEQ